MELYCPPPESLRPNFFGNLVVGEGAAPSRHAHLAFTRAYKAQPHGWCYHRLAESY